MTDPHAQSDETDLMALIEGRRLIIASNRGPVEFRRAPNGRLVKKSGSGGVVTALSALARDLPLTWVATAMTEGDRLAFPAGGATTREARIGRDVVTIRYVAVPDDVYHLHYDEISNQYLWFLQHYLWNPAESPTFTEKQHEAWDRGYRAVNQAIADAVIEEARRGGGDADGADSLILLQDYHLYLAAGFIRQRVSNATIQQFIHIPWPSVRYWQLLPDGMLRAIFEGLAANDVIGFQTERDARSFLECVRVVLPDARVDLDAGRFVRRRRRLLVRAYPITVDAEDVRKTLTSAPARVAENELAPQIAEGMRVIVRVDRLEPTKNIQRGLLAYQELLRTHPDLRGALRHLVFLVPSREDVPAYRRYAREVRRLIGRINREYGSKGWKPIVAYVDNNRARALVALRRADVVLVNPIFDGMNLVIKEAAIASERDAVLILSRTAGAYHQLAEAVLPISPLDVAETAEHLYEALTLSENERRRRADLARSIVQGDTLTDWIANQLRDAASVRQGQVGRGRPKSELRRVG
jgi:trehalose 6-phosphate synthase